MLQNTASIDNQMRHLVYLIENALLNLLEGQEQMAWLIDFIGWSFSTSVPIKSARETINILQNHYPERLAIAFLYNPPRIFEVVKYFLDAKTFQKVKFVYPKNKDSVEVMSSYFDEENLPTDYMKILESRQTLAVGDAHFVEALDHPTMSSRALDENRSVIASPTMKMKLGFVV
ncbi:hypothetical protein WN944_019296 [Citrus x changshan-huyou]|uniref:CRAL-TRIO domain-containing protein n=1 Tax=Citrus x changshan-huyou TaxID=2935761 RepID=A0AAP0LUZ8_9ROSI